MNVIDNIKSLLISKKVIAIIADKQNLFRCIVTNFLLGLP